MNNLHPSARRVRAMAWGGLLLSCVGAPALAQSLTYAETYRLQAPGNQEIRAFALADNGDVGGATAKPNGTVSKTQWVDTSTPNSPITYTPLAIFLYKPVTVKVPMVDVYPVVWKAGVPQVRTRYLNSTSTWVLGSTAPGKWLTATWATSGRIEQRLAWDLDVPYGPRPSRSVVRNWVEGGSYSAIVGGNASYTDVVKVNAQGAVLVSSPSLTTLTVGTQKTTVAPPIGVATQVAVALGEDNAVLYNGQDNAANGASGCFIWRNGVTARVQVQTALANPALSCLAVSKDGVVVGMVDETTPALSFAEPRRRVYFLWKDGLVLSLSPPVMANNELGYGHGVARGGAVALVGDRRDKFLFQNGQLTLFSTVVAATLSPGEQVYGEAMNDVGQVLAKVFPANVNAPLQYRVYSPR
jgi:hypothetical protein